MALDSLTNILKTMQRPSEQGSKSLQRWNERKEQILTRYTDKETFVINTGSANQRYFGRNIEDAIMGDYPTLEELNDAFGEMTAPEWLVVQLTDLSVFTGVKNPDKAQIENLALILADECKSLKYSELQLFFHQFKMGNFGIFYGSVDPMVITSALKKFSDYLREKRCEFIDEQNSRKKKETEHVREMHKKRWLECRDALVDATSDETAKFAFLFLDYKSFDGEKNILNIYVAKHAYDIIQNKFLDILRCVVNHYYPGVCVEYYVRNYHIMTKK